MSTKTSIAAGISGAIAAGTHTFAVSDPTSFKTLKMDGGANSLLKLLRQNYAADGWEPVMEGGVEVFLSNKRRTATPNEVGTYSVQGNIAGSVTLWTEEV
jgi:hypothetical protein